ncbi:MAG: oligoribonuclease [Candidatus Woesebacteria bacterium]|jgi:oligoribonuclease
MTDMKRVTPGKLLWLDLEMTGLNPAKDKILEVAAVVTDWNFNELEHFESGVKQNKQEVELLLAANPFAVARPVESAELVEFSQKGVNEREAEDILIKLIDKHFKSGEPALLAGNSIHMDRQFIRSYWSRLEARLHYRMLDVSAWKVLMIGKYDVQFDKQETHRALSDIKESIAELQYYLHYFGAEDNVNS